MEFQKKLFKFFPPPAFLTTRSAGLAISETALRVVLFSENKGKPVLDIYAEKQIPAGVIEDGEIKDPEQLKNLLKAFRDENELDFVRASIPERKSYIVRMEIPRVKNAEIREAVEAKLEEYVPVAASEAVFDYDVLGITGTNCDMLDLEVSVIHRKVAENYLRVFEGSGFILSSFENEAQAIARAVVSPKDLGTTMIVDFGDARTGIFMVTKGSVDFTTSIDMGGKNLEKMFQEKFSLKPNEVQDIKRNFDCNAYLVNEEKEETAALMSYVSALRDEIGKHFIYWQNHKDANMVDTDIEKVILSGTEATLGGLAQYLRTSLNAPVELANVWVNVFDFNEYIPEITRRDSFKFASAIGLALASERTVLHAKEAQRAEEAVLVNEPIEEENEKPKEPSSNKKITAV